MRRNKKKEIRRLYGIPQTTSVCLEEDLSTFSLAKCNFNRSKDTYIRIGSLIKNQRVSLVQTS